MKIKLEDYLDIKNKTLNNLLKIMIKKRSK